MRIRPPHLVFTLVLSAFVLPHAATAQSSPEIVQEALARYADRVANVNDYTLIQEINGTRATAHFEKRILDRRTTFVSISAFTVIQEALDKQRAGIFQAMLLANLGGASVEPELFSASYGQLGSFLGAASEIGSSLLGGGIEGSRSSDTPIDTVRDVLVSAAARTGFEQVAGALGGSTDGQMGQLAGSLAGLGEESILGQLGKIALGELKSLALEKLAGRSGDRWRAPPRASWVEVGWTGWPI